MSSFPVLYSFRRCPYAMRARLALAVGHTEVELREVVLRSKPSALLRASPKATVPVLVLAEGGVVDESLEIMQWALEHSDPANWLQKTDRSIGRDAKGLVEMCDSAFKQALDRCKYPDRADENQVRRAWLDAETWLQTLELRLTHHAALCGPRTSVADAAIFPFVRQFAAIDPSRWQAMALPKVRDWLNAWLQSALFAHIMEKYPAWTDGAPPLRVFGACGQAAKLL